MQPLASRHSREEQRGVAHVGGHRCHRQASLQEQIPAVRLQHHVDVVDDHRRRHHDNPRCHRLPVDVPRFCWRGAGHRLSWRNREDQGWWAELDEAEPGVWNVSGIACPSTTACVAVAASSAGGLVILIDSQRTSRAPANRQLPLLAVSLKSMSNGFAEMSSLCRRWAQPLAPIRSHRSRRRRSIATTIRSMARGCG
jgi:hypothetical protein